MVDTTHTVYSADNFMVVHQLGDSMTDANLPQLALDIIDIEDQVIIQRWENLDIDNVNIPGANHPFQINNVQDKRNISATIFLELLMGGYPCTDDAVVVRTIRVVTHYRQCKSIRQLLDKCQNATATAPDFAEITNLTGPVGNAQALHDVAYEAFRTLHQIRVIARRDRDEIAKRNKGRVPVKKMNVIAQLSKYNMTELAASAKITSGMLDHVVDSKEKGRSNIPFEQVTRTPWIPSTDGWMVNGVPYSAARVDADAEEKALSAGMEVSSVQAAAKMMLHNGKVEPEKTSFHFYLGCLMRYMLTLAVHGSLGPE